jgi:hypothetical protein
MLLYARALCQLLRFQYYMLRDDFCSLHERVRKYSRAPVVASPELREHICRAMDRLCVWYPKRVLCLQRSAATTCLLRSYGVPAQLVIGAQQLPFKAHAWVEVAGSVVNDKAYMPEIYTALDRF